MLVSNAPIECLCHVELNACNCLRHYCRSVVRLQPTRDESNSNADESRRRGCDAATLPAGGATADGARVTDARDAKITSRRCQGAGNLTTF